MFEIKVSAHDESDAICENWATKCISLLGPDLKDLYKTTDVRHFEFFDDVGFIPEGYSKWIPPTKENIQNVLEYSAYLRPHDKLLVHCHAGVSRSTAMLLGILCQHGIKPSEALNMVLKIRPQLWPNDLVIQYCDEILNLDGSLIAVVRQYKIDNARTLYWGNELVKQEDTDAMKEILQRIDGLE